MTMKHSSLALNTMATLITGAILTMPAQAEVSDASNATAPTFKSYTAEEYQQTQQTRQEASVTANTSTLTQPTSQPAQLPAQTTEQASHTPSHTTSVNAQSLPFTSAKPQVTNQTTNQVTNQATTNQITNSTNTQTTPQNHQGIVQQINAYTVKTVNNQEQLTPITARTRLKQGDTIEYQVQVRNTGQDRINSMLVTLDIPSKVQFADHTSPDRAMGSVDGTKFYYMPMKSRINGVLQNMPLNKYKAIRWQVDNLAMGETSTLKYRAKIK